MVPDNCQWCQITYSGHLHALVGLDQCHYLWLTGGGGAPSTGLVDRDDLLAADGLLNGPRGGLQNGGSRGRHSHCGGRGVSIGTYKDKSCVVTIGKTGELIADQMLF